MIRVLFFTNIPSPYRVDFFNELGKLCDLTVLYERSEADDRNAGWLKKDGNRHFKSIFLKGKKIRADSAFCLGVIRYWKSKEYDIKIVGDYATPTGMLSCIYMRVCRIRYGIECDGGFIRNDEKKIVKLIKTVLLSKASFVFSPGKMTDRYVQSYGVNLEKIYRYPFTSLTREDIESAKESIITKNEIKKKLGIEEEKIVLSVGQMIYRKGFDILLESSKHLGENVGVYIIGGEPRQEYIDFVEKNQLKHIHFVRFQRKKDLMKYYLSADVFAFPTREDIWGLVIGEAMSFGLPVITTNRCVAGMELLRSGGGIIIPVDDSKALEEALQAILNDDRLQKKYSNEGLEIIKGYTVEKMAKLHFDVLKRIL